MPDDLTTITKSFEHFVVGIVGSFYRLIWAITLIILNPFKGALRVYAVKGDLGSRLMLLFSSAFGSLALWVSISDLHLIGSSSNIFRMVIKLTVVYILFDFVSRLAAYFAAPRGRRRRRATGLMRYGFSSYLIVISSAIYFHQLLEDSLSRPWLANSTGQDIVRMGYIIPIITVFSLIMPILIYAIIAKSQISSNFTRKIFRIIGGVAIILGGYILFDHAVPVASAIERKIDRKTRVHVIETSCIYREGFVEQAMAIENDSKRTEYITPSSFKIHITTTAMDDSVILDEPDPNVYYIYPLVIEGSIVPLTPGSVSIVRSKNKITNFLNHVINIHGQVIWCRVETNDFIQAFDSNWHKVVVFK